MSKMETEPELATEPVARTETGPDTLPLVQTGEQHASHSATTLFAGITGGVDLEQLRTHAAALAASGALDSVPGGAHLTLAYPGPDTSRTQVDDAVDLLSYPLPAVEGTVSPWAQTAAAQAALLSIALDAQAQAPIQAIVLLHHDLAALAPSALMQLGSPVLARQADLVMASYTQGPFDSLLNHGVLAPLARALYGKRVRFPLAPDFALSPRLAARLAMSTHSGPSGAAAPVLWPATVAAGIDAPVLEARLALHHPSPAGDMELSTVIALLAGSAFAEMETHAPLWQRVRAAPHTARAYAGAPVAEAPAQAQTHAQGIDTAPMVNSFLLGSRSLQDVWGMLLPPVTLLDLKRLTQLAPGKFRMPDELWVRIVYDFALGYRLRTINRTHLLGALTPLYLGWVASFVNEAGADPAFDAVACSERLARAFEDGKPYLVRRWRWPDRFNP